MHATSHLLRLCLQLLTLASIVFTGGCATHELWVNDRLDNFHKPSIPHGLAIYELPGNGDFLVQYDDMAPNGGVVRRSYLLIENQGATASARKPHFLPNYVWAPGSPLPLFLDAQSNGGQERGTYVVLSARTNAFQLYRKGPELIGEYNLPIYPTAAGNVKRVLLTPFTLAVDATIVGGAVIVWAALEKIENCH